MSALHALPPWRGVHDFDEDAWAAYLRTARAVQRSDAATVTDALDEFSREAGELDAEYPGYEHESKPFILMRIVFAIPESALASERFSYKGWSNWPEPDSSGRVNPGWPVTWQHGGPTLVDSYEGSMGQPYAAAAEYRFLLEKFPFRNLD